MSKPALGRGLGALLGGAPALSSATAGPSQAAAAGTAAPPATATSAGEVVQRIPLSSVRPGSFQPRKEFPEAALRELADSIREQGIVQPLIVRPRESGFELIAGERRWRAAQMIGLTELPVIVRTVDDRSALELALIENLQRENLNPMEEAEGFAQLVEQFRLTQEEAAAKVGKSRAAVANALRLLKLPDDLKAHVRDGRLSAGHAKVLLGLAAPEEQRLAADRVLRRSLNVRQTEALVAHLRPTSPSPGSVGRAATVRVPAGAEIHTLQEKLQQRLGTKVELRYRRGKGVVQIHFFSDDDLERVLGILGLAPD